jgi:hypothetical protein
MITTAGRGSRRSLLICTDCGHPVDARRPSGVPIRWTAPLTLLALVVATLLVGRLSMLSEGRAPELVRPENVEEGERGGSD